MALNSLESLNPVTFRSFRIPERSDLEVTSGLCGRNHSFISDGDRNNNGKV